MTFGILSITLGVTRSAQEGEIEEEWGEVNVWHLEEMKNSNEM
jgi:hypothetical protein